MPKQTWVNVGGVDKKVTNVWTKVNGVWKQKVMPKGIIGELGWKEFMTYDFKIYELGTEFIPMILTDIVGDNSSVRKNPDHINLYAESDYAYNRAGRVAVVTDIPVDLTSYSKLKLDLTKTGSISAAAYLIVSPNKRGSYLDYTAMVSGGSDTRNVIELDVSSLSGEYYIRLHAVMSSVSGGVSVNMYQLWLE